MRTEWKLTSPSKICALTEKKLLPGDPIISYVFKNEVGELIRKDVIETKPKLTDQDLLIGWWQFTMPKNRNKIHRKEQELETLEFFFISLFESNNQMYKTVAQLKFYLALMLEKKQILKRHRIEENTIVYKHKLNKSEYSVSTIEFSRENLFLFADTVIKILSPSQ